MASKKRKKDIENNGDDHDYDMNPNIKINIENNLDDDSITPEYLEELSKNFFKLANAMRSKDNEDDSENNGNNNGNNIENINTNSKKGSGMFTSQKEFANKYILEIYNVFIHDFDNFSKAMNRKQPGSRELKEIVAKSFNPAGSGLKILAPQLMFTQVLILLAQIKAGNNSRELKNEIRQLLYSLYKSKQINKTVYKNLIATI